MLGRGIRNGGIIIGGKVGIVVVGWGIEWGIVGGNVWGCGWGTVCTGVVVGVGVEILIVGVVIETVEFGVWFCVVGVDKR